MQMSILRKRSRQNAVVPATPHPGATSKVSEDRPAVVTRRQKETSLVQRLRASATQLARKLEKQKGPMKKLTKTIVVTAASAALLWIAAQNTQAGPIGHGTNSLSGTNCVGHTNAPADAGTHLATMYAAVFPFDANADGQLDSVEQTALATAISSGTFAPFGTNHFKAPPSTTGATNIAAHIAAEYAVVAPFDTDKNGQLDSTELAALASAISAGTVTLPMGHVHDPDPAMEALEQQLLATYDTNGNGVLDPSEWAQIEADVKAGKLTLPGQTQLKPTRGRVRR
jgi:hypothetical protein